MRFATLILFMLLASARAQATPIHAPPDPCGAMNGIVAEARCGWAYERGDGRPQEYAKAFILYLHAAQKGDAVAQDLLGRLYRDGHGVPENAVEAAKWFRKSADQLSNDGKADLGILYAEGGKNFPPNYAEAFFWLSIPHWPHEGDLPRLFDGRIDNMNYQFDPPYIDASLRKAMSHLTEEQRNAVGIRVSNWEPPHSPADDVGSCYANGNGVLRKPYEVGTWCQSAAQRGYEPVFSELGNFYFHGFNGIKQDDAEAYFWLSLAVKHPTPVQVKFGAVKVIADERDKAASHLTPTQKSAVERRVQEWKATTVRATAQ